MVFDAAVAAWLRDIETANCSGACNHQFNPSLPSCLPINKKRARIEEQQTSAVKRQRQHLALIHPNMAMPRRSLRSPSPSKKKEQQLDNFNIYNNNMAMTAVLQEQDEVDIQQTPRPFPKTPGTRRDSRAAGSTGSPARVSPFSDNNAMDCTAPRIWGVVTNAPVLRPSSNVSIELTSTPESVSPSQSASQIQSASSSQLSGPSERSSPRRPKSPVRSGSALRNAEKPVHFRKFERRTKPSDVEELLKQLGDIDTGMGVVPHVVKVGHCYVV